MLSADDPLSCSSVLGSSTTLIPDQPLHIPHGPSFELTLTAASEAHVNHIWGRNHSGTWMTAVYVSPLAPDFRSWYRGVLHNIIDKCFPSSSLSVPVLLIHIAADCGTVLLTGRYCSCPRFRPRRQEGLAFEETFGGWGGRVRLTRSPGNSTTPFP